MHGGYTAVSLTSLVVVNIYIKYSVYVLYVLYHSQEQYMYESMCVRIYIIDDTVDMQIQKNTDWLVIAWCFFPPIYFFDGD